MRPVELAQRELKALTDQKKTTEEVAFERSRKKWQLLRQYPELVYSFGIRTCGLCHYFYDALADREHKCGRCPFAVAENSGQAPCLSGPDGIGDIDQLAGDGEWDELGLLIDSFIQRLERAIKTYQEKKNETKVL